MTISSHRGIRQRGQKGVRQDCVVAKELFCNRSSLCRYDTILLNASPTQSDPHVQNISLILVLLVTQITEIGIVWNHGILRAQIASVVDPPVNLIKQKKTFSLYMEPYERSLNVPRGLFVPDELNLAECSS